MGLIVNSPVAKNVTVLLYYILFPRIFPGIWAFFSSSETTTRFFAIFNVHVQPVRRSALRCPVPFVGRSTKLCLMLKSKSLGIVGAPPYVDAKLLKAGWKSETFLFIKKMLHIVWTGGKLSVAQAHVAEVPTPLLLAPHVVTLRVCERPGCVWSLVLTHAIFFLSPVVAVGRSVKTCHAQRILFYSLH